MKLVLNVDRLGLPTSLPDWAGGTSSKNSSAVFLRDLLRRIPEFLQFLIINNFNILHFLALILCGVGNDNFSLSAKVD